MKLKIVAAFVSVSLLSGCSQQIKDIDWKFWEKFSGEENNANVSEEVPAEKDKSPDETEGVQGEPEKEPEAPPINENEYALDEEYFTVLNQEKVIENTDNILLVVNKNQALPADYVPADLTIPNVAFSFEGDYEKKYLREEAARALEDLFAAATSENVELFAVSGYRSYETQYGVYNSYVKKWGEEKTNTFSAIPGHSEHQTGLTMDISSRSNALDLTEEFGETPEGQWVKQNAYKHGFIIRYPKGKEVVTGYQYEPWHLRYVGKEVAEYIHKHDITLEEFFDRAIKQ
ncbi:LAS superfamily LD-carboxypeptidase LdcB [Bacillus tianshenii]|uniref:LAS superfamily LD-carboxypeptidase LdcB n=1 Tax=Sutcliffiella tianshenii TaxID=1463404 RepID=A0ABS2NXH8_9BACI|nr:M15 family metallopeptidase [Bacillus tianshenii]MBM7619375.1 LAS superfamily LD-carboxypeptidase LdcB [Bacillus tianshenii]